MVGITKKSDFITRKSPPFIDSGISIAMFDYQLVDLVILDDAFGVNAFYFYGNAKFQKSCFFSGSSV